MEKEEKSEIITRSSIHSVLEENELRKKYAPLTHERFVKLSDLITGESLNMKLMLQRCT